MKEKGVVSWKLPPREMSCKYFREIFPSENNHVYSIKDSADDKGVRRRPMLPL